MLSRDDAAIRTARFGNVFNHSHSFERGETMRDGFLTSSRPRLGGARGRFEVTPDPCCLDEAMADGFALSALVDKREFRQLLGGGGRGLARVGTGANGEPRTSASAYRRRN